MIIFSRLSLFILSRGNMMYQHFLFITLPLIELAKQCIKTIKIILFSKLYFFEHKLFYFEQRMSSTFLLQNKSAKLTKTIKVIEKKNKNLILFSALKKYVIYFKNFKFTDFSQTRNLIKLFFGSFCLKLINYLL